MTRSAFRSRLEIFYDFSGRAKDESLPRGSVENDSHQAKQATFHMEICVAVVMELGDASVELRRNHLDDSATVFLHHLRFPQREAVESVFCTLYLQKQICLNHWGMYFKQDLHSFSWSIVLTEPQVLLQKLLLHLQVLSTTAWSVPLFKNVLT